MDSITNTDRDHISNSYSLTLPITFFLLSGSLAAVLHLIPLMTTLSITGSGIGLTSLITFLRNNQTTSKFFMRLLRNEIAGHLSNENAQLMNETEQKFEKVLDEMYNKREVPTNSIVINHDPKASPNDDSSDSDSNETKVSSNDPVMVLQQLHIKRLIKEIHKKTLNNSGSSDTKFEIHIKGLKHNESFSYHESSHE